MSLKKPGLTVLSLLAFLNFAAPVKAAVTTVTDGSLLVNSSSVGRYQKFEATFKINRTFTGTSDNQADTYYMLPYYYYDSADTVTSTSPNGTNGISIDGHFIGPSGTELVQPAFYFQNFTQSSSNTLSPLSDYSWKLRFAPIEVGAYRYYIKITDKNGTTRYPADANTYLNFTSTTSSSKGFIRVSATDPRFWMYDSGQSFVPVSSAHQGAVGNVITDYQNTFNSFGSNGINFVRIWDQNDGYNLTVEGSWDGDPKTARPTDADSPVTVDSLAKGTQMNQKGNFQEDKILEAAEKNNVYIQLCSHGDTYWLWDASTYGGSSDSWNRYQVLFMDQKHINYVKRNYRYRIARWGYSTSVFAWEYWNEQDRSTTPSSDLYQFYQTMSTYVRATDPYKHLITTSNGSQNWRLNLWSSAAFDVGNFHDYLRSGQYSSYYNDEVRWTYVWAQCLRAESLSVGLCPNLNIASEEASWQSKVKPIVWGENDLNGNQWDTNPQPVFDHNVMWAGLFSPIGMGPIDWYFTSKSWLQNKYIWAKIASDFFSSIDYAGEKFTYLSTSDVAVTASSIPAPTNSKLRVLAMRSNSNKSAYAWVQHKDYVWSNGSIDGVSPAISGSFTIPGMAAGSYKVQLWNTHSKQTPQYVDGGTVTANSGNVTVTVSNLSNDVAVKIVPASGVPTTTLALPTLTPTPKPGDADGNGVVNGADYGVWLANYGKTTSLGARGGNFDGSSDGLVNGVDYGIWLAHYGT